jgi:hypothetical protein
LNVGVIPVMNLTQDLGHASEPAIIWVSRHVHGAAALAKRQNGLQMSLEDASEYLAAAVRSIASSEQSLQTRLQVAWSEHLQLLWMQPCLTIDLLREFNDIWHRYTAPSDDRRSTKLRELNHQDLVSAVSELVALSTRTAVAAAHLPAHEKTFASLADLE